MSRSYYRPDIDGLRAVAVVAVLLYHAGLPAFSGGFVGVDVFFVISGFLITSLLRTELDQNRFSLWGFWERRVRRIVPALLAVVLVCLAAGWFVLLPRAFQDLCQSALAQSLFASNMLFWRQAGYFDGPSELKPLLHTWSLAVEEQYYLLYPPLLAALTWMARRHRLAIIACAATASFAFSLWAVTYHPTSAFYLLPSRGWELLLGAGLALADIDRPLAAALRQTFAISGILAIVAAVGFYQPATPFPGLAALLPCAGTAALIWTGANRPTAIHRALAWRPVVAIGLISYSLYLWHWPVLVFMRYRSPLAPLSGGDIALALLCSTALAFVSWKFIEMPFRTRRLLGSRPALLTCAAASIATLGALGGWGYLRHGYPDRMTAEVRRYQEQLANPRRARCHLDESSDLKRTAPCELGDPANVSPPVFVAFGDSHLDATVPVLDALARQWKVKGLYLSYSACPPLLGVYRVDLPPSHECPAFNDKMAALLRASGARHAILVARWSIYTEGWEQGGPVRAPEPYLGDAALRSRSASESREVFRRRLSDTVAKLEGLGADVWILKQVPEHKVPVADALARLRLYGAPGTVSRPQSEYLVRNAHANAIFAELASPSTHILDPMPYLCAPVEGCRGEAGGRPLYLDDHHLTPRGSLRLAPVFRPLFELLFAQQPRARNADAAHGPLQNHRAQDAGRK